MTEHTNTDAIARRQTQPGTARPVEPGKLAFSIVSDMENETGAIRDLAYAIIMASSGANEVNADVAQSALVRIGWQMVDQCDALETKRCEVFGHLLGVAHAPAKAVQS